MAALKHLTISHDFSVMRTKKLLTNSTNIHETRLFLNIGTYTAIQDASDDRRWQIRSRVRINMVRPVETTYNKLCGSCYNMPRPLWLWPLTFWPWKWCPSHVWRGLPLCQF